MSINAYKKLAQICDYPLHLGITEAGGKEQDQLNHQLV